MPSFDESFLMNHTCLRIKDPKVSVKFYEENFGMKLVKEIPFPELKFTLYMMGYETSANKDKSWGAREGILELCHNHGVENDDSFTLNNGNEAEFRGFGHICLSVDNIEAAEKKLLGNNVAFKKKLSDGRQKNIAFALDPNGYWIELIEHATNKIEGKTDASGYKFNHSMIRVKDPKKSLDFYRNVLGFKLFKSISFEEAKFTLYFLGYDHNPDFVEGSLSMEEQSTREGLIELTHNWGTESDDTFEGYHNGNSTENGAKQGFGHTCVSCKDPATLCQQIEQEFGDNVDWSVKWNQGTLKELAFIRDPDGYSIEIFAHDILSN